MTESKEESEKRYCVNTCNNVYTYCNEKNCFFNYKFR